MARKPLGRGLSALLSAEKPILQGEEPYEIEIEAIDPSPIQPRTHFDQAKLAELSQSIVSNGVVQPLLVRKKGTRYELIAGERRWRAAQQAGLARVPVVVRDVPDDRLLELALIENIQREDLNAIEEAHAYKKLIETIGLTQESLAERVGRDRSYITNYLRLLRLPEDIQRLVQEGKLSTGHARTLLATSDVDLQRRIARKIIDKELSVRETERLMRRRSDAAASNRRGGSGSSTGDANIRAAETKLQRRLGTKVRITRTGESLRGKIEIEFYDTQDLDRIYRLLIQQEAATAV